MRRLPSRCLYPASSPSLVSSALTVLSACFTVSMADWQHDTAEVCEADIDEGCSALHAWNQLPTSAATSSPPLRKFNVSADKYTMWPCSQA